jgi:tRNA1Val (adenine37-N6)-methyltransferase
LQPATGYRFSLDPFLLSSFCTICAGEKVVDLGTGVGLLPLLLERKFVDLGECVGVEIQPAMAELARQNFAKNLVRKSLQVLEGDLREYQQLFTAQSADAVVANPPFRTHSSGKLASEPARALARHELAGGIEDFVAAAAYLLKNSGRFYVIFLAERLTDLLAALRRKNIEPKRLRMIHSRVGQGAKLVMVEGRRAGKPGLKVDPPLYIYDGDQYSAEVLACYGEGDI